MQLPCKPALLANYVMIECLFGWCTSYLLKAGQSFFRINIKHFGLLVRFDIAAFAQLFEHVDLIAQAAGLLEPQVGRRLGHFGPHVLEQFLSIAFQKHPQPFDVVTVLFLANPQIAPALQLWVKGTLLFEEGGFNGRVSHIFQC